MTKPDALARIYETYTENELLNAKDEPDTDVVERFTGSATVATPHSGGEHGPHTVWRRIKRAFLDASHG